jgi:hypothetical protein
MSAARLIPMSALSVLLIFFSGSLVLSDAVFSYGIARQFLTRFYSRTMGTITHSRVVERTASEGGAVIRVFEVRYLYEVDGRRYEGTRYRYGPWSSSDGGSAKEARKRFAVGATVPVFYRPGAPDDACLTTVVPGHFLFMMMGTNPFKSMLAVGWYWVLRRRWREGRGAGFFMADEGRKRLLEAVVTGFVAFGAASLVALLALGNSTGGNPPLSTMVLTWNVLLAIGVFSGWLLSWLRREGSAAV